MQSVASWIRGPDQGNGDDRRRDATQRRDGRVDRHQSLQAPAGLRQLDAAQLQQPGLVLATVPRQDNTRLEVERTLRTLTLPYFSSDSISPTALNIVLCQVEPTSVEC